MKNQVVIGVDVSKETLDFVVLLAGKKLFHMQAMIIKVSMSFVKRLVSK